MLADAAPAGGQRVALLSSDPGVTIPTSVVVRAGMTSVKFHVKSAAVEASTEVWVFAVAGGLTGVAELVAKG